VVTTTEHSPPATSPYRSDEVIANRSTLGDFRGGFLSLNISLAAIKTGDKNE
jgi:hypothetical protein